MIRIEENEIKFILSDNNYNNEEKHLTNMKLESKI
ncbi:MAG: hypothetical protein RIR51_2084, partial [Bacteroidota bacterium]